MKNKEFMTRKFLPTLQLRTAGGDERIILKLMLLK
jgi:hypothetical protein